MERILILEDNARNAGLADSPVVHIAAGKAIAKVLLLDKSRGGLLAPALLVLKPGQGPKAE